MLFFWLRVICRTQMVTTTARALRLADGPDEVHLGVVARSMLAPYRDAAAARTTASQIRTEETR